MNLSDTELAFFPDGVAPDAGLMENNYCLRIVLAWLQAGDEITDGAQWLVNACAYQELRQGQELQALCAGYLQLYRALAHTMQENEGACAQLHHTLLTYCKLQLANVAGVQNEAQDLMFVPTVRNAAESLIAGYGRTERQVFFNAILDYVAPAGWLQKMAAEQQIMWLGDNDASEGVAEKAAEQIGKLWQYLFDLLLPADMQTAFFCENCLRGTYFALAAAWPQESVTWRDITDSFINTLEIEQ